MKPHEAAQGLQRAELADISAFIHRVSMQEIA
jgi:hypothetical protein